MEFPPYPNDEDNEQVHVYNLYHLTIAHGDESVDHMVGISSRPRAINFSSKKKMEVHIMELVLKCPKIDPGSRSALEALQNRYNKDFKKREHFDAFVKAFRVLQLESDEPLGFDIYWDEEPNVLL